MLDALAEIVNRTSFVKRNVKLQMPEHKAAARYVGSSSLSAAAISAIDTMISANASPRSDFRQASDLWSLYASISPTAVSRIDTA